MRIIHITRRGMALSAAAVVLAVAGAVVLAGCFAKTPEPEPPQGIPGATDEERTAYLTDLGWEVEPTPLETVDLQLPEDLSRTWGDYAALQEGQGLPFAQYAGQAVRRYTYTVLNYPGIPKGVQANLYVAQDCIIGGDIIATGQGGFQGGLAFPETENT